MACVPRYPGPDATRAAAAGIDTRGSTAHVGRDAGHFSERKDAGLNTLLRRAVSRIQGSLHLDSALRLVWQASPRWTVVSLAVTLLQAGLPILSLYLMKLAVDALAAGARGTGDVSFETVVIYFALLAGTALLGAAAGAVAKHAREAQGYLVTDRVLEIIHEKSVAADYAYYEDPRYHDTLHRAQREAPHRPPQVLNSLLQVTRSGLTVLGALGLLATAHWGVVLLLVVGVAPVLWVRLRHADRRYRWEKRRSSTERRANYLSWLLTNPNPAKEVRIFGLGRRLVDRFRDLRTLLREEKTDLSREEGTEEVGAQIVVTAAAFAAFVIIAFQTYQGAITVGSLVMYLGAVQKGRSMMTSLFQGLGSLYESNLFLSLLDDFLDVEPSIVAPDDPEPVPSSLSEGLAFEDVTFRYPGSSRPMLEDVNLEIRPGEAVALVGPNGAGKSTVVKLLCRLYDPQEGRVTLDGVDIRRFDPGEYRRVLSVVFQDFGRYHLSARDNIAFGDIRRDPGGDWVREAAKTANVAPAIEELRDGYETVLGRLFEDGEELSIGEWQKVALARMFAGDGELMVVDEPSSALDAAAEAELFDTIRRLVTDRSALLISHRFSTVRMADRIYVLDDGRVVESGSHEQLMEADGKYARLFRLQAAPYREDETPSPPGGLWRP